MINLCHCKNLEIWWWAFAHDGNDEFVVPRQILAAAKQ